MKDDITEKYKKTKKLKLISAIAIDVVGILSYFFPVIGGSSDIAWAPISGVLISLLFPNRKKMAFLLGVSEELLPFTDFIPTAFLAWRLDYVTDKEKTLSAFLIKEGRKEQLVKEILNTQKVDDEHFSGK